MLSSSIIIGRFRFFMICRTYFAFGTSSTHSKNVFFKSVESLEHMAKWCWASHPKVTGSSTIVVTLCLCPQRMHFICIVSVQSAEFGTGGLPAMTGIPFTGRQ